MKKIRDSNIELLRIVSIVGVIILHYNNDSIGGAFGYSEANIINHNVLLFLECLCICAVNLFILITGYFMSRSNKRSVSKPINLLFQVVFFSLLFYIISIFIGKEDFSIFKFISCFIPANYFVILYITIYFLSLYFNKFIQLFNKKSIEKFMLILIILFSLYPTCTDLLSELYGNQIMGISTISMQGSQSGYTIVNFSLMYFIGAYLQCFCEKNYENKKLIRILIVNLLVLFGWAILEFKLNSPFGKVVFNYFNPLIILESIVIFLLFKNINLNNSRYVNTLASSSFTVFLTHSYFLEYFKIQEYVSNNLIILLIHLSITVVSIYFAGFLLNYLYNFVKNRKILSFILLDNKGIKNLDRILFDME